MSASEIAAWWGAVVASLVLLWDVFKWVRSGPKLRVSIHPNRQVLSGGRASDEKYFFIEVSNVGDRSTTISNAVGIYHKSLASKLIRKPSQSFVSPNPAHSPGLPFILNSGATWSGGILQESMVEDMAKNGYLYWGIVDSSRSKPHMARVVIN